MMIHSSILFDIVKKENFTNLLSKLKIRKTEFFHIIKIMSLYLYN